MAEDKLVCLCASVFYLCQKAMTQPWKYVGTPSEEQNGVLWELTPPKVLQGLMYQQTTCRCHQHTSGDEGSLGDPEHSVAHQIFTHKNGPCEQSRKEENGLKGAAYCIGGAGTRLLALRPCPAGTSAVRWLWKMSLYGSEQEILHLFLCLDSHTNLIQALTIPSLKS